MVGEGKMELDYNTGNWDLCPAWNILLYCSLILRSFIISPVFTVYVLNGLGS